MDAGEDLVGGRVEGRAAVDYVGPEALEERPHPLSGGHRDGPGARLPEARLARGYLLAHVRDVQSLDVPGLLEHGDRDLGLVGVDVDLERRLVSDHEHRVPQLLEPGDERARLQALAGDDEIRAVAKAAVEVMRARLSRRLVMRKVRELLGAVSKAGHRAHEDHHQAVGSSVDDAGLGEHLELARGALDGLLAGASRHGEDLAEQLVLLRVGRLRRQALAVHMGEMVGDGMRHLADHGQHRALRRIAHRLIGRVGGPRECRGEEHRVDQLARPARQLLCGAADDLAQDHPGVAPGPHQRGTGNGVDDLLPIRAHRLAVEAIELPHHRLQGQRHVVARVPVGDREDVQIVDLLAAGFELGVRGLDDPAEALDRRIGHRRPDYPAERARPPS